MPKQPVGRFDIPPIPQRLRQRMRRLFGYLANYKAQPFLQALVPKTDMPNSSWIPSFLLSMALLYPLLVRLTRVVGKSQS